MKRIIILLVVTVLASVCNATFDLTLSGTEYNSMTLNNQSLLVTGGGAGQIIGLENSYIEVWGTTPLTQFSGIGNISLADNSTLLFSGGEMNSLWMSNNATAIIEGGRIDYIDSRQYLGLPHIEMVVKDYTYNAGTNFLTGIWGDDSTFNIQLVDQDGYDPVFSNIAFTIVPEPASLLLFGAGAAMLGKKRKRK